jgi:hypothetical protein
MRFTQSVSPFGDIRLADTVKEEPAKLRPRRRGRLPMGERDPRSAHDAGTIESGLCKGVAGQELAYLLGVRPGKIGLVDIAALECGPKVTRISL